MGKQAIYAKGEIRTKKIISSGIRLFLENGYENTTTAKIMSDAGMSQSAFFASFDSKEDLLGELVKVMFENQFKLAENLCTMENPLLMYAVETTIQLQITELSEELRELYLEAYSLPTTSEIIHLNTAKKLAGIFKKYLPDAEEKDFYEMEIASGSVMRGFMSKKCDMYFTFDRKVRRFLECNFKLYDVPRQEYLPVIESVVNMDLQHVAEDAIEDTVRRAEENFEAVMSM